MEEFEKGRGTWGLGRDLLEDQERKAKWTHERAQIEE